MHATSDVPALRRTLGPVHVMLMGVGAIAGTGIFVLTGTAVAGGPDHVGAGPALILWFVMTGGLVAVGAGLVDSSAAAELTSVGTLAAFALVSGGVWWLRRTQPGGERPFRVAAPGLVAALYGRRQSRRAAPPSALTLTTTGPPPVQSPVLA